MTIPPRHFNSMSIPGLSDEARQAVNAPLTRCPPGASKRGENSMAKAKKSDQRGARFARGGTTSMHGRGDRTVTAKSDAAEQQQPGATGHKTSSGGKKKQSPAGGVANRARPA
jgi:hypothetical protein